MACATVPATGLLSTMSGTAWIPVGHFGPAVAALKLCRNDSSLIVLLTDYRNLYKHESTDFVADFKQLNPKLSGTDERIMAKIRELLIEPDALVHEQLPSSSCSEIPTAIVHRFEKRVGVQRIAWRLNAHRVDDPQFCHEQVTAPILSALNAMHRREQTIMRVARQSGISEGKLSRALEVALAYSSDGDPFASIEFRQLFEDLCRQTKPSGAAGLPEGEDEIVATAVTRTDEEPATGEKIAKSLRKRVKMAEPVPAAFFPATRTTAAVDFPPSGDGKGIFESEVGDETTTGSPCRVKKPKLRF